MSIVLLRNQGQTERLVLGRDGRFLEDRFAVLSSFFNGTSIMNQYSTLSRSLDTGLSGATRVYYIVGDPIAQVRSPEAVTAAMRSAGRDVVVVPAHVAPAHLEQFFSGIASMRNVDGIIVTVPHKFEAIKQCATLTDEATFIGAVNVMRRGPNDGWHGGMFDGAGMVSALLDTGAEIRGRHAVLIGAGGAGTAIGHSLIRAGVSSIEVRDNAPDRARELVARLNSFDATIAASPRRQDSPLADNVDLVINASPMGMQNDDDLTFYISQLTSGMLVGDVITKPPITPLIEAARLSDCITVTGNEMFDRVRDGMVEFLLGQGQPL